MRIDRRKDRGELAQGGKEIGVSSVRVGREEEGLLTRDAAEDAGATCALPVRLRPVLLAIRPVLAVNAAAAVAPLPLDSSACFLAASLDAARFGSF